MSMTTSISTLKPIHPPTSSMVRFGMQSPSSSHPVDQVELSSDNPPPGIPIDMYRGDITQCQADAIIVGVYKDEDVFRKIRNKIRNKLWKQPNVAGEESDTHDNTVQPLSGEVGKVDKALNGAILKSISANEPLPYFVLNTGDLENWPLVLSKSTQKNWGIPAKHVIVVGLGDRPDSSWGTYETLHTLQSAHKKALAAIDAKPEIKTVATALHCADTGVFKTRDELDEAAKKLREVTENYAQRVRSDKRPFPLQKLSIISEHPELPTWVIQQPPEPTHSNFLQRTWNNIKSFFSNIWETIKRVIGFGSTSTEA